MILIAPFFMFIDPTPEEFNVPGTWYQMAVADAETDELVGDCAIHFLEDGQQVMGSPTTYPSMLLSLGFPN